uniref:GMC family oxidoreductase n=1 Tax=Ningiella ruwaisensis TaxID=2364274 RepID=UPI00109FB8A0|nr:GMC family oxidoreductase N-terminal domain-containing protein [Ningiella ruwaisensis]
MSSFDVVIVGAGSAGCVLASRISENPDISVCLLEAGPADNHPAIHIPFGLALMSELKSINWHLETAKESQLNNRKLYWPRGKTLGGSSSINAMCYIRGDADNYNEWEALGAKGWGFKDVLPYFRKSENNTRGISKLHGSGGPQDVSDLKHINPLTREFISAATRIGTPENPDFNGISQEGVGIYQVTHQNGSRCSTAKGFLSKSVKARENLTILTQANAKAIIFENTNTKNKRAEGVVVDHKGKRKHIMASKHVYLCAGAIHSPNLLLNSGVGPKDVLDEVGIEHTLNLDGVGKNLQDHLDATILYRQSRSDSYGLSAKAILKNALAPYQYWRNRSGMLTSNIAEGGAFIKSSSDKRLPDIQVHFLPALLVDHGRSKPWGHGFTIHFCNLYPKSRGQIRLKRDNQGILQPSIHANYLHQEEDLQPLIAGFKWARQVARTQPLARQSWEFIPGDIVQTDEEIEEYLRENAETVYHPAGTCKMGAKDDHTAVVNPDLTLKGIENISIADASVMPKLIGGNTNAPTIMIAEKAADIFNKRQK